MARSTVNYRIEKSSTFGNARLVGQLGKLVSRQGFWFCAISL
jgi:hypothetical protein